MNPIHTGIKIHKTLKNAHRMRAILSVFARYGFRSLIEAIHLDHLINRFGSRSESSHLPPPVRLRKAFEELGPTFIKLGQVLSTRSDLIPQEYIEEFVKLQDNAVPLDFEIIFQILKNELGPEMMKQFQEIEETPIGSASIAQVHRAHLITGEIVVIKVQRPGIMETINNDLHVLYTIASLIEEFIPELRVYQPVAIVDEYFKTLRLETHFVVEANNIRRFQENFREQEKIIIPQVYHSLCSERILTMEALEGTPLSKEGCLEQLQISRADLIRSVISFYMKMVFVDGLFHGDLHPGNVFVYADGSIGLIDFGVIGRLNKKTQLGIASMLLALAKEDYEQLASEYIELSAYNELVDTDQFAKDLRELIAPYFGLNLRNTNVGRLLLGTAGLAGKHHISVPAELLLFFKSLVHVESLGRRIDPDFDFLPITIEVADSLVRKKFESQRTTEQLGDFSREGRVLFASLPKHLNYFLRKWNSPNHAIRFRSDQLSELSRATRKGMIFISLSLMISSLILASALTQIFSHNGETSANHSGIVYLSLASFLGVIVSYLMWRRD